MDSETKEQGTTEQDEDWRFARSKKEEQKKLLKEEAEIAAEEHTEIVKAAIRKKYPRVKKIIKLKVGGLMNKGIYRLCFGNQLETVLRKLRTLQTKLNEKRTEMNNRGTKLLSSETTWGSIKELKGLIIGGFDKNFVRTGHLVSSKAPGAVKRAEEWLEGATNIEQLIERCSNPTTTINDCFNKKDIDNIELVNNITVFGPRLMETPRK